MEKLKARFQQERLNPGNRPIQEDHAISVPERGIWMVADGFGGGSAGADAARLACDSARNFLMKEAGDPDATLPFVLKNYYSLAGNVLFNALVHANQQLLRKNQDRPLQLRGGASAIVAYLDGDFLALAQVGCCQAWLLRDGHATELVRPRSYRRLREPRVFPSVAEGAPGTSAPSVPLMALGLTDGLEPEIVECCLRENDWLVLATDGIPVGSIDHLAEQQVRGLEPAELAEAAGVDPADDNSAQILVGF